MDVSVGVVGGDLVILGTPGADRLLVSGGPGAYSVAAFGGTTFNDGQTSGLFSGVTGDVRVNLRGGDDTLILQGFTAANDLDVATGGGDDAVTLNSAAVIGRADIDLGGGSDLISVRNTLFVGPTVIDAGGGSDQIDLTSSAFFGPTIIDGGPGNDTLIDNGFNQFARGAVRLRSLAVPFSLTGAGSLNPATGFFAASGTASLLGTWVNQGIATLTPIPNTPLANVVGEATFLGQNRDRLDTTFDGVLNLDSGQATGQFFVQGGTGIFEGARGTLQLNLSGVTDFTFTLTGTLIYD